MSRSARFSTIVLVLGATAFGAETPKPVAPGARGGPRHDDLAAPWTWKLPEARASIATENLPSDAAKEILSTPPFTEDSKAQLRYLDVTEAGAADGERKRIAAESAAVKRQAGNLTLTPRTGPPIVFKNKNVPERKDREGDRVDYLYAGRLGKGGLLRVETWFSHDAPGSYLVSPADGRSVFVHEGSDHVALSGDDARLLTFNDLNPPATLVVVSLASEEPAIELVCRARAKAGVELKGWHGADAVDVVLRGETGAEKMPVRLERTAKGWRVLTPEASRPLGDFACGEGPF